MIVTHRFAGAVLLGLALLLPQPLRAGTAPDRPAHLASISGVIEDLGKGRGTLITTTFELQGKAAADSWSLAPTFGHRERQGLVDTAVGATVGWRRDWGGGIRTGSELFLAEAGGPFARLSLAQSLGMQLARRTQLTAAVRWSRYRGGQDVWFVSGEGRRYFRRGSAAYRLTWVKPADQGGHSSHLMSFTLNDAAGSGRTQLWLSQGQASLATANGPDSFRGQDRAVQLRRVQPLGGGLALSLSGGLASYALPAGTVHARNAGIALSLEF